MNEQVERSPGQPVPGRSPRRWHNVPYARRVRDDEPVGKTYFVLRDRYPLFHLWVAYGRIERRVESLLAAASRLVGVGDLPGERWLWALSDHLSSALYQFAVEVRPGFGDPRHAGGKVELHGAVRAGEQAGADVLGTDPDGLPARGARLFQELE